MKLKHIPVALGLLLGFSLSFVATYVPPATAARNSSGTYSLPAGNPVVTGTTISSTWANNTLTDISTELTNSLDRGGRGAMTAPLPCSNGTAAAPSLTFASDTDTGLYRIGANNPGLAVAGALVQDWTTGGTTIAGAAIVSPAGTNVHAVLATGTGTGSGIVAGGGTTSGRGGFFLGGAPNGLGIVSTGLGTGTGGLFTGGSSGRGVIAVGGGVEYGGHFTGGATGAGVFGTGGATGGLGGAFSGTGNTAGVQATGNGAGVGVDATGGGTNAAGLKGTGGATNGIGVLAQGTGSGAGVSSTGGTTGIGVSGAGGGTAVGGTFANGTAQNATTPRTAVSLTNGNLSMLGVTNVNSDVVIPKNTLTPASIVKAFGNITTGASPTVNGGGGIASATCAGSVITVNFVNAMADTNYAVIASSNALSKMVHTSANSTTDAHVTMYDDTGGVVNLCSFSAGIFILVIGAQ